MTQSEAWHTCIRLILFARKRDCALDKFQAAKAHQNITYDVLPGEILQMRWSSIFHRMLKCGNDEETVMLHSLCKLHIANIPR